MKVNRLESDVVEKEETNEDLKNNMEELVAKHELLQLNNEKLTSENAELKRTEANLNESNQTNSNKIIKLEDELSARSATCNELESKLQNLVEDSNAKSKALEELRLECDQLRSTFDKDNETNILLDL